MEEAWFMTYTSASHQGAIHTLWVHFLGTVISSLFTYPLLEYTHPFSCLNLQNHLRHKLRWMSTRFCSGPLWRLPFTHEQRRGRFLSRMCSQQHRNLQCTQVRCSRQDIMYKYRDPLFLFTAVGEYHQKLSWPLCQFPLRVWHCFFIQRCLYSVYFFFIFLCHQHAQSLAVNPLSHSSGESPTVYSNWLIRKKCYSSLLRRYLRSDIMWGKLGDYRVSESSFGAAPGHFWKSPVRAGRLTDVKQLI